PLEKYAQNFDELFNARAQREGFRRYLEGLLLPAERNKTLTVPLLTPSPWWEPSIPTLSLCSGSYRSLVGGIRTA
ncbi:MAG: hypothetical protein LC674_07900, partial [Actinobacteria bacterium]|nr:hypothetical protein [Actinomycetota bacterium]